MELKIFIRQLVLKDKLGNEQHIGGMPPKLIYTQGKLPQHRQFPSYGQYLNVTSSASDLYKLKLTWTQERTAQGLPTVGESNLKKAASGSITFEGEGYKYLRAWLVDDVSAPLNTIEVKIHHNPGDEYIDWVIKATDISWCDGELCTFDVSLKQKDEVLTCIKNTWIADDWQGWFGTTSRPSAGKRHPRFSYCNEIRPNGMLITLWWTMTQLMSILGPTMLMLATIINPTILLIVSVLSIINGAIKFINTLGGNINTLDDEIDKLKKHKIDYKDIKEIFGNFFLESGGCGREHPAPLIRDYIDNVCKKCGVHVDGNTVPVFFSQSILIETSADRQEGKGAQLRDNLHYNACYFNGVVDKGIRRFDELNIFNGAVKNTTDWWLPGNAPLLTLDALLDQLKTVYNAEWRVENNTLYFNRKDSWLDNNPTFDLAGADKNRLLQGICYEWDETKTPLYAQGLYAIDPADVCGNNACNQMNGYASFGSIDVNPMLDGVLDKTTQFGATKFRLDGASTDYLFDAMQQVINTTLITGSVWTTPLFATVNGFFRDYANYALLLKQETAAMPKILIWDGQSYENAKCIKPYHSSVSLGRPTPAPNVKYNSHARLWEHVHEPQTKVSGRKLVPPPQPHGAYEVRGLFGSLVTLQAAQLVNYPMYFEPGYRDTLWDWFHWIDDPNENPKRHLKFTARLELCDDILARVKPFNDAAGIIVGQKIKLPLNYINEGRITEVEISYDITADTGPYVQLKGIV